MSKMDLIVKIDLSKTWTKLPHVIFHFIKDNLIQDLIYLFSTQADGRNTKLKD